MQPYVGRIINIVFDLMMHMQLKHKKGRKINEFIDISVKQIYYFV